MWCGDVVWWCGVVMWCGDVVWWCGVVMWWCNVVMWCGEVVWWGGVVWWCVVVVWRCVVAVRLLWWLGDMVIWCCNVGLIWPNIDSFIVSEMPLTRLVTAWINLSLFYSHFIVFLFNWLVWSELYWIALIAQSYNSKLKRIMS